MHVHLLIPNYDHELFCVCLVMDWLQLLSVPSQSCDSWDSFQPHTNGTRREGNKGIDEYKKAKANES